jgi:hypothetical protein
MRKGFLDVTTARAAIKDLVTNIEGVEYDTTYIPVNMKVSGGFVPYNVLVLYKRGKYEEMLEEIYNNFEGGKVDALLKPSENYIQLAIFEIDENIPNYDRSIRFSKTTDRLDKNEMTSFIVDPKYAYIDDVMNKWFAYEEKIDIKRDDDIFRYVNAASKKGFRKNAFVKKLFRGASS